MLESVVTVIMTNADGKRDDIQQQLHSKKQDLVENYVREQQKLYAEILPEVCYYLSNPITQDTDFVAEG